MKEKIDAAVQMLKKQGHSVDAQVRDGKEWFQIDGRMLASSEEMRNLGDGVYSLAELEELFIRRRVEETSPDELAEGVINEWAAYARVGHAKELPSEFKVLTIELSSYETPRRAWTTGAAT